MPWARITLTCYPNARETRLWPLRELEEEQQNHCKYAEEDQNFHHGSCIVEDPGEVCEGCLQQNPCQPSLAYSI